MEKAAYKADSSQVLYRISIQIDLSGFSFNIYKEDGAKKYLYSKARENFDTAYSSFSYAGKDFLDRISSRIERSFDCDKIAEAEISFHTEKFTLVPLEFYSRSFSKGLLEKMHRLDQYDEVDSIVLEDEKAVLIYALPSVVTSYFVNVFRKVNFTPSVYHSLKKMHGMKEYNKVIADYRSGLLVLVIADFTGLQLCNSYHASDFKTALYYIVSAVKEYNFNPEQSLLVLMSEPAEGDRVLAMKYFYDVVTTDR